MLFTFLYKKVHTRIKWSDLPDSNHLRSDNVYIFSLLDPFPSPRRLAKTTLEGIKLELLRMLINSWSPRKAVPPVARVQMNPKPKPILFNEKLNASFGVPSPFPRKGVCGVYRVNRVGTDEILFVNSHKIMNSSQSSESTTSCAVSSTTPGA